MEKSARHQSVSFFTLPRELVLELCELAHHRKTAQVLNLLAQRGEHLLTVPLESHQALHVDLADFRIFLGKDSSLCHGWNIHHCLRQVLDGDVALRHAREMVAWIDAHPEIVARIIKKAEQTPELTEGIEGEIRTLRDLAANPERLTDRVFIELRTSL